MATGIAHRGSEGVRTHVVVRIFGCDGTHLIYPSDATIDLDEQKLAVCSDDMRMHHFAIDESATRGAELIPSSINPLGNALSMLGVGVYRHTTKNRKKYYFLNVHCSSLLGFG